MGGTVTTIVEEAQRIVGEADGIGVQLYSDDQMFDAAVRAFRMVVKKYAWHQYMEWSEHDLDGVLGIVDADAFDTVRDFEDFLNVYREDETKPLPILPRSTNPFRLSGSTVQYWTALPATDANYATRRLQFWPKEATGTIQVQARVYPATIDWDTELEIDKDILVHGTAFQKLLGDDLNPAAAEAQRLLMEMRFDDVTAALARRPIAITGTNAIPNDWFQQP